MLLARAFRMVKTPRLILYTACRQHSVDVKWLAKRVAKKCITKGMIKRVAATLPQDGKEISQAAQEQSQQLVAQAIRFLSSEEDVALRGFKLALQRNPLLVSALLRIGKIKMRADELQSSRLYIERAFVLNPGNPECVLGYADVLLALGDSYGALRVYEAIVSDFSKSEAVSDQLKDAKEVDAGFKVYLDSLASCGLLYYKVRDVHPAIRYLFARPGAWRGSPGCLADGLLCCLLIGSCTEISRAPRRLAALFAQCNL